MKKLLFLVMTALCMLTCEPIEPATSNKVKTGDATDVTTSSATLQGSLNIDIAAYQTVEFGVMWADNVDDMNKRAGNYENAEIALGNAFHVPVHSLSPDTKYYYCAYLLLNNIQYEFGSIKTFQTQAIPSIVKAAFSVAEGKQVYFSQGNLQYQASTDTWSFAEHQYDIIGTDNVIGGTVESDPTVGNSKEGESLADKIDLFGWGTGNNPTNTSVDYTDYATSTDWGVNPISNGGNKANQWRTLTNDEWEYLLKKRPDAESKYGAAQVNGVNGIILLPDSWTLPSGCSFTTGVDGFGVNSYTAAEWIKMESAGALFLPAAGSRFGTDVLNVGVPGNYWSAMSNFEFYAYYLFFSFVNATMRDDYRGLGYSVRLVYDLP